MSDLGIFIFAQTNTSTITPLAPWSFYPSLDGTGQLITHLTEGKIGDSKWLPGYIPRDGALSEIDLSVDLEAGGDYEQLRSIKIQLADQMSNGQSMDAWLRSYGVSLAGAAIAVYSQAPIGLVEQPMPLWTGVIRSTRLTDTRLELACESPNDSDPLGETVSDNAIRPIIYGAAQRLKLPPLPANEDVASPLVSMVTRVSEPPTTTEHIVLGESDSAGLTLAWTNPVTKQNFVALGYGEAMPDLSRWFPSGQIPASNDWYLEVVAGKGEGQVRRLTAGSTIGVNTPTTSVLSHPLSGQDLSNVRNSEVQRSFVLQIDFPFLDPNDNSVLVQGLFSRAYDDENHAHDTWMGGTDVFEYMFQPDVPPAPQLEATFQHYYSPDPDRSYMRLIRKGKAFSLPINSGFTSKSPLYASSSSGSVTKYVQVNNAEELFRIDGSILRVIPSAQSAKEATVYTRLVPDWTRVKSLDTCDPTLPGFLPSLMDGTSGLHTTLLTIFGNGDADPSPWQSLNHVCVAFGNPGWDLDGAEKIILASHFEAENIDAFPDAWSIFHIDLQAYRSGILESWWNTYLPDYKNIFRAEFTKSMGPRTDPSYLIQQNSMPPSFYDQVSSPFNWLVAAIKLPLGSGLDKTLSYLTVFFGARPTFPMPTEGMNVEIRFHQLGLFASRTASLTDIFADIAGPTYATGTYWRNRIHGGIPYIDPEGIPLTDGVVETAPIADHAHALEDIFRRHLVVPWSSNPVEGIDIEQACQDLWTKTQVSQSILSPELRPKIAMAITESSPQVGDVCAQICRDGMLVGSRNGWGRRTAKAWLSRTLLEEQDATILESDLFRGSISEAPTSPPSKLCSSPLIRYCQQGGAPTQYVQIFRPDASSWQSSFTQGFPDDATAMRAWSICHRGWTESGVAQAREIRMDSIPDIDSLIALIMQPRGNTFLDWISRPKQVLSPIVSLEHDAARLPRGSRIKIVHWKYAPAGSWGTVRRINMKPQAKTAQLEIMMDPAS